MYKACTRYTMKIDDKTKIMTNMPNGFQNEIKTEDQRLKEMKSFYYLG